MSASLGDRLAENLAFWLILTALLAFAFGWLACVLWQKSKVSMHAWVNDDGSTAYWVLTFGRNVVTVGTEQWVQYRERRMKRAIEGRDAYEHGGVAHRRWAGGSGAPDGAEGRTRLHPVPGTPGGGSEGSPTEGTAP
jgi:hypothetical protein